MPIRVRYILPLLLIAALFIAASAWRGRPAPAAGAGAALTLGASITQTSAGLRVDAVEPRGVADDVGIRAGDVLVGVDRRPVATVAELEQRVAAERRGELSLQVLREGVVTEAFLASSPRQRARNAAEPVANRHCAALTLDRNAGVYRETGCTIARSKLCNGCSG